ncbi:MAG: DUF1512 domain-containing protein [Crenarchaeota archaeon]|nr:DUF1512 domain-containing protein [Thermoproteota archaeon]
MLTQSIAGYLIAFAEQSSKNVTPSSALYGYGYGGGNFWLFLFWLIIFFILPFLFGDYYQLLRLSGTINRLLVDLGRTLNQNMSNIISTIENIARKKNITTPNRSEIENRIKDMIEYVVITPTQLEPQGLVAKLKHLMILYDHRLEDLVRRIIPAEKPIVQNLASSIEALRVLNFIYKIVMHYYKLGMKYKNPWILLQVYMALPQIKEFVNALNGAISAFTKGQPIGDSAGPLTAFKFLREKCEEVEPVNHSIENTYIARCRYNNRIVYVIKALGPGSNTGRIDDAVIYLVERCGVKPKMIITVDAALKLEGEKTGTIAEGIGVAIGGIGVEKFNIETIAARYGIPLYAILIKMSMPEALTLMTKEVAEATGRTVDRICRIIEENVKENEEVILIGVGNTIGVGQ